MCIHVCTCVYMCVHVCTCVYMCVHVCTQTQEAVLGQGVRTSLYRMCLGTSLYVHCTSSTLTVLYCTPSPLSPPIPTLPFLQVNGQNVRHSTHQQAVQWLVSSLGNIELLVEHVPQPPGLKVRRRCLHVNSFDETRQSKATTPEDNSFFLKRKNELPQAGFEPATFCVLGRHSTNCTCSFACTNM